MGKTTAAVEKKKKKGRPSLLDLQKRNLLIQQQNQNQNQKYNKQNPISNSRNPNPKTSTPVRRSTRRNPSLGSGDPNDDEDDEDEEEESNGRRREKKLKLVLRIPPHSSSANSRGGESEERSYGSDDSSGNTPRKKRRISAVAGRAGGGDVSGSEKGERRKSNSKATDPPPGTPTDSIPRTPLPDKKLLEFILDRLQKKDTYGVFSEPVDLNELPDYLELIEHPMDFSTVRKKLSSGAYANLEQFEKDVLLISSNAMRYNAQDTIYFRQARSIQELARKDFEHLRRRDSEDNVPEMKTVRRGRPPGKGSIKRAVGRPPLERAGSDFSSDATLANAVDNSTLSNSNLEFSRKAHLLDKTGTAEGSVRTSRNGENHGWLTEHKSGNDEFPGSLLRGMSKFGKKPFIFDENRRSTYKTSQQSLSGLLPSVFTTLYGEKNHLMAVGVHMEHAYARSLARFAESLGPIAWKVASKKIEKVLPTEMKFGPGWVGENDAPQTRLPLPSASSQQPLLPIQNHLQPKVSPHTMPRMLNSKVEELSEKQEPLINSPSVGHFGRALPTSASKSAVINRSSDATEGVETVRGTDSASGFGLVGSSGGFRPKPPFQISQQNSEIHSPLNGFKRGYVFNTLSQIGKLVGVGSSSTAGNYRMEALAPSGPTNGGFSRSSNNSVHPMPTNCSEAEDTKPVGNSNPMLNSCHEGQLGSGAGLLSQPSWWGNSELVPPDLNIRFQSPGSPASGMSQQPDLALQL